MKKRKIFEMRKNPYNEEKEDQIPLFMLGSKTFSPLTVNMDEAKKTFDQLLTSVEKKYNVGGTSFTMIQPPMLSKNLIFYPPKTRNMEIGQFEVTQELFESVMGSNFSTFKSPSRPAENMTWYDCLDFCNKLNTLLNFKPCYEMTDVSRNKLQNIVSAKVSWDNKTTSFRLPAEGEWTLFAKAGTENRWAGCNSVSEVVDYAWYADNAEGSTHSVGEKLPNEWNIYDMSGNVWEWCWDLLWSGPVSSSSSRVLKGGCWFEGFYCSEVDFRGYNSPKTLMDDTGFRLIRNLKV